MKRTVFYILVFAVMAFAFYQSGLPAVASQSESDWLSDTLSTWLNVDSSTCSFLVRKTAHFCEFAAIGFFAASALACDISCRKTILTKAWLSGTLWAITDEQHQMFVAGRSCELRDVFIDSAGTLAGALAALCIIYFIGKRKT